MPLKYKLDDISFYGIKSKVKKILHFDLVGEILQVCVYVIAVKKDLKFKKKTNPSGKPTRCENPSGARIL